MRGTGRRTKSFRQLRHPLSLFPHTMAIASTFPYPEALSRLSEAQTIRVEAAHADCEEEEESYIESCLEKSMTNELSPVENKEDKSSECHDDGLELETMSKNLRAASRNVVSMATLNEYERYAYQLSRVTCY